MTSSFSGSSGDGIHDPLHVAVVHAVAAHRNVDPLELPPLYEWIDPDSLDTVFESTRRNGPRRGRLEFPYDGHVVVVDYADSVTISVDGSPAVESITAGPDRGPLTGVHNSSDDHPRV
ncbi:hypothetical protein HYG81_13905 [Natrinema zhouii]|uniref:Halobacterial output domain-containing protein n=1 Tax=Natrinema zhouii TaxID=1710539 RepID=A0A7D6CMP2_9EURY|nr:HalOD1 output domain-containing protein [Natrinema zhouii]QLK25178.1 hypothetical protein HYG81_13905 [Natrinema zhouii]